MLAEACFARGAERPAVATGAFARCPAEDTGARWLVEVRLDALAPAATLYDGSFTVFKVCCVAADAELLAACCACISLSPGILALSGA